MRPRDLARSSSQPAFVWHMTSSEITSDTVPGLNKGCLFPNNVGCYGGNSVPCHICSLQCNSPIQQRQAVP